MFLLGRKKTETIYKNKEIEYEEKLNLTSGEL